VKPKKAPISCDFYCSIREKIFFSRSHLEIWQILGFVSLWTQRAEQQSIEKQIGISNHAAVDWASFCREIVFDAMILNRVPLGGPGKTVEIDESKFGKRKHHRGHHVKGQWVFGGLERESGRVFMVAVDDRTRATLLPIIKDWILPGTTIISDCWKPYDTLNQEDFDHLRVNHSISFKDPVTGAHTNAIESSWRHAKDGMSSYRRHTPFFPSQLAKYMFLKKCKAAGQNPTTEFFKLAGELYAQSDEDPVTDQDDEDRRRGRAVTRKPPLF
jgi:transposase-like protein